MRRGFIYGKLVFICFMRIKNLEKELKKMADPAKAKILQRYFKTGKGEYAEGDVFLGLSVGDCRQAVKKYLDLSLNEVEILLKSRIHEHRWAAGMILCRQFRLADQAGKKRLVDFYLKNARRFNNWDLVDGTAPDILGGWLAERPAFAKATAGKGVLEKLARSENLWERRIAIMAAAAFIDRNQFADTLKIAEILLQDKHDLIHKAVGWMLREVGKRDLATEEVFLHKHAKSMPRTMLRYAIEKFPEEKRKDYLQNKVPSNYFIKALRESEEERLKGRVRSFKTADQALTFIDKVINEKRSK